MTRETELALDRVTRGSTAGRVVSRTLFALLMLVLLSPFWVMLTTAISGTRSEFVLPPTWFPRQVVWSNFATAFSAVPLARYFLNSLIIAGGATLINAAAAIPAAFALSRLRFRGRKAFLIFVIATQMISPIVLLIASFKLLLGFGLLNTYWSLIFMDATISLPITIWIMTAYMSGIPQEIQDAATLDGVGYWRMLKDHFVPLAAPAIATALVFSYIIAWNEFLFAVTFVTNPAIYPLTTGIYNFVGETQIQWNFLMAASLLSLIPVFVVFLIAQKRLTAGLTAGTVK